MTTSATFNSLRVNNAEQFKGSIANTTSGEILYLTFGKVEAWPNEVDPQAAVPSDATIYEVWNNMIGGKRLYGGDFAHVIPRYDWTPDTVYSTYDDKSGDLFDQQFYVITDDYNVYKCIGNNYIENYATVASTVKPTSVNPSSTVTTSDGYTWKYMYTLSSSDQIKYVTPNYIPVKTLKLDDGSLQWQVQNSAISGTIDNIAIIDPGMNYDNASNIIITITGDGTSAAAIASINTELNIVETILITDRGFGYTYANVSIISLGAGEKAEARAIISPPGGHGKDPLYELGGKNILVTGRFKYDEGGTLPVTNDYRQIALIKDPFIKGTLNVSSLTTFSQVTSITTSGTGNYNLDEWLYQGSSFATATFKGRVVSWSSDTGKVTLIDVQGTPTASQSLIGQSSFVVRSVASVNDPDLVKYSGKLLYVDNIKPVTRSSDQIEDFKLIMKF
jgi:hypothetical protein